MSLNLAKLSSGAGGTKTSKLAKSLGNASSFVDGASSLLGPAGSLVTGLMSLIGGGAKRRSRLVNNSIESAKKFSNVQSGTLESYNAFLRELSKAYQYQYVVKKRKEGAQIKDLMNEVETFLKDNGYVVVDTQTLTQSRSKGDYSYSFNVYAASKTKSVTSAVTGKSASDVNGTVNSNTDTIKIVAIIGGLYLLFSKKFRRKFKI